MRRRTFVRSVAVAALAIPSAVRAQQPGRMPLIGYLGLANPESFAAQLDEFRLGLATHGFVEGRNVRIEYRWADGDRAKLPVLAEELVRMPVDVVTTSGGYQPPLATVAITDTIPIIASSAADIVDNLARPTRNLTGAGTQTGLLDPKRLELLNAAIPDAAIVTALQYPVALSALPDLAAKNAHALANAAASLRLHLVTIEISKEADFDDAFGQIGASGAGALLVTGSPFLFQHHRRIIAFANRSRLPAIYEWAEISRNGGLMAYGDSIAALNRRAGDYVGRVLKGAKPADLPIDLPPQIRLTTNLKTAQEIGFTFPPGFQDRADEVIE
jgi:putative tryptophan/tyrosine transport system substrate-binding protein